MPPKASHGMAIEPGPPDEPDPATAGGRRSLLGQPHKVIILHRDGDALRNLQRVLTAEGFTVVVFKKTRDLLKLDPPDLMSCLLLEHDQSDGICGLDACNRLRDAGWSIPVVYVSASWKTRTVVLAMRNGADNFLTQPIDPDTLIDAVHGALQRSRQTLARIKACAMLSALTDCERRIIEMAACGMLNKEIADCMNLAVITVKVYRARAMRKLGAGSAAELGRIVALAEIDRIAQPAGDDGSSGPDGIPQAS